MSVHEDLLNNGENNCSFTEDEVDIMCSKDAYGACGDGLPSFKEMPSLSGVEGDFERNISKNHLEKLNTDVVKIDLLA